MTLSNADIDVVPMHRWVTFQVWLLFTVAGPATALIMGYDVSVALTLIMPLTLVGFVVGVLADLVTPGLNSKGI